MAKKWVKEQNLREKSVAELKDRAQELKASLFAARFQRSSGKLENYRTIPETKHRLAALLTIIREKELEQEKQAHKAEVNQ